MTIIVFLIDNSLSMSQRTYLGTTLLDIAKGCVEEIFKIRLKFSRSDRYYIYSLDEEPNAIKSAECKQNLHVIRSALNVIHPSGFTSLGIGIRRTFDLLNLIRMGNGLENYGMGRYPSQVEPAIVVCITDGENLTSELGTLKGELTLPVLNYNAPGHEYTLEPFRWDYRFYSIVLRIPVYRSLKEESSKFIQTDLRCPIRSMCEVTGGRAYKITNVRTLHQCLESLSQKCQPGVVLHFRNLDGDENDVQPWHICKKMIYVKSSSLGTANSHWPIPEPFWPDEQVYDKLPPRTAHPIICFSTQKTPVPKIMDHFPVDRYELEPSPLTQHILEKHDSNFIWKCYVPKSGKAHDHPFGYLKASSDLQSVHLYVLVYNYPHLFELLSNLFETLKSRVTDTWASKFAHYLAVIPKYYFYPLSRAIEKIGVPNLIKHDSIDRILPYILKAHLQKLRQNAKLALEKEQKEQPIKPLITLQCSHNLLKRSFSAVLNGGSSDCEHSNSTTVKMQMVTSTTNKCSKIPRLDINCYFMSSVVDRKHQRTLMGRAIENYKNCVSSCDSRIMERECIHEQPMAEMGDYANYKYDKIPEPLKEIMPAPERKETFGNPFRRKSSSFEADEKFVEDMLGGTGEGANRMLSRRSSISEAGRRKGRLPLNVTYYNWRKSWPSSVASSPTLSELYGSPVHTPLEFGDEFNDEINGMQPTNQMRITMACSPKPVEIGTNKQNYHHNRIQMKKLITILRHPKIDGGQVFQILRSFKGPYKLQNIMICRCLQCSIQFKRHKITSLIQQYLIYLKQQLYRNGESKITSVQQSIPLSVTVQNHNTSKVLVNGHVNI